MEKQNLKVYYRQLTDEDAGIRHQACEYIRRVIEYNTEIIHGTPIIERLGIMLVQDNDTFVRFAVSFALIQLANYDLETLKNSQDTLSALAKNVLQESDENTRSNSFEVLKNVIQDNATVLRKTTVIQDLLELKESATTVRDRFRATQLLFLVYNHPQAQMQLAEAVTELLKDSPQSIRDYCEVNRWPDLLQHVSLPEE